MDPFFKALSLFRLRKYEQCIEICNQLLASNPTLQGPWELKMRAMTQRVYVDDIEAEEDAVTGSIDCQHSFSLFVHIFQLTYCLLLVFFVRAAEEILIAHNFMFFFSGA